MTAPAEMPGFEEIARVLAAARKARQGGAPELVAYAGLDRSDDVDHRSARAILDLFAPILAEKERHHASGERITRKDLNNAHRKGADEGRLAAHLIDGVNSPLNACCYRDGCQALEARALAAEAAARAVLEHRVGDMPTAGYLRDNDASRKALAALAQIAAPGAAMEAQ